MGVLCVEFFVLQDGSLVVNEIAPRPHNSGHYSQNACDVSQFELQVRAMARPAAGAAAPAQPRRHAQPAGRFVVCPGRRCAARRPGLRCWPCPAPTCTCTAKRDAKRGRKMGHLNITAATPKPRAPPPCKAAALLGIDAVLRPHDRSTAHLPAAIATAARALRSGALLGLPTETVYGLAADAGNDAAVAQIFAAKGRPSDHPLIVHVADASRHCPLCQRGARVCASAGRCLLARPAHAHPAAPARAWPPPPPGGQDSVGLRCPAHPVAQRAAGGLRHASDAAVPGDAPVWGVAAPSANRFGRVSPTTAAACAGRAGRGPAGARRRPVPGGH